MQRREDDIPADDLLTRITVSLGPKLAPDLPTTAVSVRFVWRETGYARSGWSKPGVEVIDLRLGRDRT